jgi:hypothetical protein
MAISDDDLKRRDKLLGMLSSDFDGERATASAMLAKMAAGYKMTIPELCQAQAGGRQQQARPQPNPNSRPNPQPGPQPGPQPNGSGAEDEMLMHLRQVMESYGDLVTPWEEGFLESVTQKYSRDDALSEKQKAIAMRILTKVAMNAGRPRSGFKRYGY